MPGTAAPLPPDDILYLSRAEVAAFLPPVPEQLDLVERTYAALAAGRVELPPKPGLHPRGDAFLHAMPAHVADTGATAIKWVSGYPSNKELGLPYISGLIVVNDAATGFPVAVMDAAEITAARTAAASGACARRFAPEGWCTAAILGCGEQGRYHAEVLRAVQPALELRVYDPDPARAAAMPRPATAAASAREAVAGAEVVVTAGPIVKHPRPEVVPDWLGERWLLLPIDFDALVTPAAVAASPLLLVDDVGQFEYYRTLGHFQGWPAPHGSAGAALAGARPQERAVCCNLGVGALDAAFAHVVAGAARAAGAGTLLRR